MTYDAAHRLIKKGDLVFLRHELDGGMSPDLSNRFSWTLLMLAALEGNIAMGELLISKGATIDKTNDFGETALSLAAHGGHTQFIRVLLAHGASRLPPSRNHSGGVDERSVRTSQNKIQSILDLINSNR